MLPARTRSRESRIPARLPARPPRARGGAPREDGARVGRSNCGLSQTSGAVANNKEANRRVKITFDTNPLRVHEGVVSNE